MINKDVVGRGCNQIIIAMSLAKGARLGEDEYLSSFIPNLVDIPHHVLLSYIKKIFVIDSTTSH